MTGQRDVDHVANHVAVQAPTESSAARCAGVAALR
jgi:hypothetical protein